MSSEPRSPTSQRSRGSEHCDLSQIVIFVGAIALDRTILINILTNTFDALEEENTMTTNLLLSKKLSSLSKSILKL
ncbi:hypothetical protein FNW02_28240 [Komarekiella sp. 'clone 1']|uniref:Uncharacterized protein n=1 Tax=Komarekiella delphini-convector SJRDD-AB1 TaxID=2593771 RepID=A0AA40VTW7_9NOST|nr:hypothetical protein [Komarekiella delphini-convector]MBD6619604.1 hypothetical protein [Komarekiella delphini-convector SJRDD-AB1]